MADNYWSGHPEDNSQPIQDFWEQAHERNDEGWLTGSPGLDEWTNLDVVPRVLPGVRVLNIGVGLGRGTLDLAAQGCRVTAVDISSKALDRVRSRVAAVCPADNLQALPSASFDLALSHLVAQHMSDADLQTQFTHVMRSLADTGLFAVEFITYWEQSEPSMRDNLEWRKRGGVGRTLGHMCDLSERAGGRVIRAWILKSFHVDRLTMYIAHIVPRRAIGSHGVPVLPP
jgi:SAM-dependent methyltransferase